MSREGYVEIEAPSGKAWVLPSRIGNLQRIDAVFFDCDGVLVDVRESYHATVVETVRFVAKRLMGLDVPCSLPLGRGVLELKRSGGFNNDWDVSYALLLSIYACLLGNETVSSNASMTSEGMASRSIPDRPVLESSWQRVGEAIVDLGRGADSTGLRSVEKAFINEGYGESLSAAKRLLGYPVEASIVARVFDEIFYGPQLFRQKFKVDPKFYTGRGLIEKETLTISRETLSRVKARVGREKTGIISGRDRDSAKKTLGGLLDGFEPENLLFLMVDPSYDGEGPKSLEQLLNKPDPEILLRVARTLGQFQCCLYVGDSAEDLIMVQRANELSPRFAFAGVYDLVDFKEEVCSYFLKMGADMVLPSVNDLPQLLEILGEWKR